MSPTHETTTRPTTEARAMHPTRAATPPTATRERELLIALGAAEEVSRAAACRLGGRPDALRALLDGAGPAEAGAGRRFGVPDGAWRAALRLARSAPSRADRELEEAARHGARIVTAADAEYPEPLRDLELPPPALYVRGAFPEPAPEPAPDGRRAAPAVAIVGSRRADAYGREAAELFGRELAAAGLVVVSGFARGVDAAAHRGALEGAREAAGNGRFATVAFLGTGHGVDYPRGHRRLGDRIAEQGAVATELPCGTRPKAWHFPVRNRLIAALAAATLVVRAVPRSGSLITARFALDLGRDVLALPGRIFEERSMGTNSLIADGAFPARHPRDVLDLVGVPEPSSAASPTPGGGAVDDDAGPLPRGLPGRILAAMTPAEPAAADALAEHLDEPADRVLGALLELELTGRLRREPGGAYVRRPGG